MPLKTHPAPAFHYGKDLTPRHSLVYNEKGLGLWVKDFALFYELYFESKVLDAHEVTIYRHLHSLAVRKLGVRIDDYTKFLGLNKQTLVTKLDKLQDALLLYRVCRVDEHGAPYDYVLMSHMSKERWKAEGHQVLDRIKQQHTHNQKLQFQQKAKLAGECKDGKTRGRRAWQWPGKEFHFSQKKINAAFDDEAQAEKFTEIVLDVMFRHKLQKLARKTFVDSIRGLARHYKIEMNDARWTAAFEIQKRYAHNLF